MERVKDEFQEEIDRFGWSIEVDILPGKPCNDPLQQEKVYLVRHALSMYNYHAAKVQAEHSKNSHEFYAVMNDTNLIDPDLHPIGEVQCEANAPKIHAFNVKYVLVSPMQRAMQTCILMFKDHPRLSSIRFVVEPWVHEILHTMNDIAMDATELVKKYAPGQPRCHGINFDFSRITQMERPNLWLAETLIHADKKARFFEMLAARESETGFTAESDYANVQGVFVEVMQESLPDNSYETKEDIFHRGKKAKSVLQEFLGENPLEESDEKLVVVTHSQLIAALTADSASEGTLVNY